MAGKGELGRALRRGAALGLSLVAVWGVGMTVDLGALGEQLAILGERQELAVSLMAAQLGEVHPSALTGCSCPAGRSALGGAGASSARPAGGRGPGVSIAAPSDRRGGYCGDDRPGEKRRAVPLWRGGLPV